MSADQNDPALDQSGRMGTFVLRLLLGADEPVTGYLTPTGQDAPLYFHGWIDLMIAINTLRADTTHPPDGLG